MTRPDHEIDAYLEGTLTDEQARAIDTWIAADPANAADFLHLVHTHQMLGVIGKEQSLSRQAAAIQPDQLDPVTLASLAEMEAAAEPVRFSEVDQPFAFESSPKRSSRSDASLPQALDDLRWAAGKAASRLIRSPYGITGALAAILLLGFLLFNPFGSSAPAPPQDIANTTPTKPAESVEPILRDPLATNHVATLTATHNARWAEGASAPGSLTPGSKLHPNQRLTLTDGLAEITTLDGAVAILEAPATVELLDNNNALRLHSGKLVGICETESSKGFFVRTPHMDITDLGTRFGVDATAAWQTRVKVFEGEVEAALTALVSEQPERRRLTSGHALAAQTGLGWSPAAYEPNRFVMDLTTDRLRPEFAGTNAVWLGRVSHDLEQDKQEADALQVFIEQRGLMLAQAVPTDFDSEQEWDPRLGVGQQRVEAGQRIDVYLLHYDLVAGHESSEEFVINFDRPILGVIGAQETLNATDASLGSPKASYPHFVVDRDTALGARGINPPGFGKHPHEEDIVSISADGTQLRLRLWGGTPEQVAKRTAKMDQIRVIVQAAEAAP